ncbi:hypothetical protein Q9Q94_05830 [Uliginosibacterium sp. 31-16]|uniref:hypothetical protein n=1 Tax=Uliginosibacterium sp. 31-16 TaxID=3068315 RepID=UPI00273F3E44|nr:hypothetical protein [Uliginosibacterium sp. 31-16]MDP5239040.1 hypothetical protein [Uliginosibacterium sp. 31-16]
MPIQQPLEHLDATALQDLIDRYYAGENVAVLLQKFNVACCPRDLWRHFPPSEAGRDCPVCSEPLVVPRLSRTGTRGKITLPARCTTCLHVETLHCACSACSAARRVADQAKELKVREAIANFCANRWSYTPLKITPDQMSAEAAIALLSLVRCGGWLNDSSVGAIRNSVIPFAPQGADFPRQLLDVLLEYGLVAPQPNSPAGTFVATGEDQGWEMESAHWELLFPDPPDFIRQLECLAASSSWPEAWLADCHLVWKKLAAAECWEFCKYSVQQRDLPMPGATALSALIENLLQDYSVSQCYQLIWASAADATDYRARKRITAQHAANYLIGACQRRADRSRAEDWPIKGFKRNFELGRTQVSHVLHDVFLTHGEAGFFSSQKT